MHLSGALTTRPSRRPYSRNTEQLQKYPDWIRVCVLYLLAKHRTPGKSVKRCESKCVTDNNTLFDSHSWHSCRRRKLLVLRVIVALSTKRVTPPLIYCVVIFDCFFIIYFITAVLPPIVFYAFACRLLYIDINRRSHLSWNGTCFFFFCASDRVIVSTAMLIRIEWN